jgi:hypothetical protein
MRSSRLTSGFAAALLALAAIWAVALKPEGGGYRLLQPEEAAMVRGGSSISIGSTSSSAVNISLNNVPYVTRYLSPAERNNTEKRGRDAEYCGIASALMVRAKYEKNASRAPSFMYDANTGFNYTNTDSDMRTIDDNLLMGRYGYNIPRPVDVLANKGLLYIDKTAGDSDTARETQYNTTVNILKGVFTGKVGDLTSPFPDFVLSDNYHVTSVSMRPISAALKGGGREISDATKAIWNHIRDYRQPVVVVVDSNKQILGSSQIQLSSSPPTLHYIVITGINETNSGDVRYFSVYNPADRNFPIKYTEENLRTLIALPDNTPAWVHKYGNRKVVQDPAYILTVQGD